MSHITVGGKTYEVTKDALGITYIDGMTEVEWMDSLPPEARLEIAQHGAKTIAEQPLEYIYDIMERVEMPESHKRLLLEMRKAVRNETDN